MRSLLAAGLLMLAIGQGRSAADVEHEARALDEALIAPCCFTQQVSVHSSAAAEEVRQDVRSRLRAGQSRQQILDAYVAQYGKRILAEPPASGFDLTLHVAPVLMFLGSAFLVAAAVRRLTLHRAPLPAEPPAPRVDNAEEDARLDDELAALD